MESGHACCLGTCFVLISKYVINTFHINTYTTSTAVSHALQYPITWISHHYIESILHYCILRLLPISDY